MPCPHCGFDESDPEPPSVFGNQQTPQNDPNSAWFSLVPALRCVPSEFDLNLVFLV
jgi:hypothetical protein